MPVSILGCREDIQTLIESYRVEVNRVLKGRVDGTNAPQRGATVRSPRCVEQDEYRFPLGHEIGRVDLPVAGECQHVVGRAVADTVSDGYGLLGRCGRRDSGWFRRGRGWWGILRCGWRWRRCGRGRSRIGGLRLVGRIRIASACGGEEQRKGGDHHNCESNDY